MIKHIVFWKLKEEALGDDKATNALLIKEVLSYLQTITTLYTMRFLLKKVFLAAFLVLPLFAGAGIKLPNVLTSNMVLQREKPVAIWGEAQPGETVTVQFAGQTHTTQVGENGQWMLHLDAMPASFEPRNLHLATATADTTLQNILVGEVWLCGGQSNMEYPMCIELKKYVAPGRGRDIAGEEWRKGGSKKLRLLLVDKVKSLPDCTTKGWQECCDSTVAPFSAVGYFYGKYLQEALNVPVGLIASSWGGSRIEPWTPVEAYEKSPLFAAETVQKPFRIDNGDVASFYNSMIAPLAPYTLKGFIWYQGESNAMIHDARYVEKTRIMLDAWRSVFQNPNAPFYYVQIAPYFYTKRTKDKLKHTPETMAEFCELQTKCLVLSNTGQAVVTDLVDDLANIHPSYKWEVGRRLSLWALAKTYGQSGVVFSGPQYKSMKVKKGKIELTFDYIGSGLTAGRHNPSTNDFEAIGNEDLTWFTIAGSDTVFHVAKALIVGDKVLVSCPEVKKPKYVRFAWSETAMPNFFNKEGLPAVPFRTEK